MALHCRVTTIIILISVKLVNITTVLDKSHHLEVLSEAAEEMSETN